MGREAAMWDYMRGKLMAIPGTDLCRIENGIVPGTPDVNGCLHRVDFWCELKCIEAWPSKAKDPVHIDHYTVNQRNWIRRRGKAGGRVSLMLKVLFPTHQYLLFLWPAAFHVVGVGNRQQHLDAALVYGGPRFPLDAMVTGLIMPPPLDDKDYVKTL